MKKSFKITGLPALITIAIIYSTQCLLVCGIAKLLTLMLHIDFNLELTVVTFVVCKALQIIGYFAGFRWE
ncbi:MAG: hypothetical protein ACLS20_06525 [Faecalimonas umbilicata]|uniref:hypothetical protein n=1 Tax=Faecalimonas umbilicata TaxID=1912855 RepID=UPI00034E9126|nr:hypothetical protein HMPREF1215_00828 [Coprococcus sp. HPP0074]